MIVVIVMRSLAPLSPVFAEIANFSGLGAIAIFGGSYIKNRVNAFLLPILVLALSDFGLFLVAGKAYVFYPGWEYTYIAFALMVLVGKLVIKKVTVSNILIASVASVFVHWIVTDFGVWYGYDFYPHTLTGFWTCLNAAIPFERIFLASTLIFAAVMFGAFELLKVKFPSLSFRENKVAHS